MMTKRLALIVAFVCIATSTAFSAVPPMISYQGKLMQPTGVPVPDGTYSIRFAIYDAPTAGNTLWSEVNPSVQVKGGLFATMLGSVVNLPANIFDGSSRFFGVKVGDNPEMTPRQQVASVAFAVKAGSADTAATATTVPDGAITTSKVAPAAITADKLAVGVAIPPGGVIMWSGAADAIPQGWALCDGTNGTPDLRNRFIVGAGDEYAVAATGGEKLHKLTVDEMPNHTHGVPASNASGYGGSDGVVSGTGYNGSYHWSGFMASPSGNDQLHENRPPYYALCFIIKQGY